MKVEELTSYGKAFDHLPLKAQLLQAKVMFSELIKKFGLFGIVGFLRRLNKRKKCLIKQYDDTIKKDFSEVPSSAMKELYMMGALYYTLSDIDGKEEAYDFIRGIIHKIGPTVHGIFYAINDLKKCKGDIYTNFCKLNRSIFENSGKKGFYDVEEIKDSENLQYVRVTKCLNVDLFTILGCPEMARIGCDFDISGYAPEALGNEVNLDFRRPHTLVNGDKSCEFYYYRKEHAPPDMRTI